MSFCCGASMLGTKGTMKHIRTHIHHVPLLFCPVCKRVEVHYLIENEYDILAEYAHGDGATDIDFEEYVDERDPGELFANCVNVEMEDALEVVHNQIDMALDLMQVAKAMEDAAWEKQLLKRLNALSERQQKLCNKKSTRELN